MFALPGPTVAFNLVASSLVKADEDLFVALSLPGVKDGELEFIKGGLEPAKPNWVDRLLEEQVSAGEAGGERAGPGKENS